LTDEEFLKTLYDYHAEGKYTDEYFKDNKITFEDVIKNPFHLDEGFLYYLEKICDEPISSPYIHSHIVEPKSELVQKEKGYFSDLFSWW
jgi:hypothetical protein